MNIHEGKGLGKIFIQTCTIKTNSQPEPTIFLNVDK